MKNITDKMGVHVSSVEKGLNPPKVARHTWPEMTHKKKRRKRRSRLEYSFGALLVLAFFWWLFLPPGANYYSKIWWDIVTEIRVVYFLAFAFLLEVTTTAMIVRLKQSRNIWRYKWFSLSKTDNVEQNLVTRLTRKPRIGKLFLIIMVINMPMWVYLEEWSFREVPYVYASQYGELAALVTVLFTGVVAFGLLHYLSGYDVATTAVVTIFGACILTFIYVRWGLGPAIYFHLANNLVALSVSEAFPRGQHYMREFLAWSNLAHISERT